MAAGPGIRFRLNGTCAYTQATEADPRIFLEVTPTALAHAEACGDLRRIIEEEEVGQVALELSYIGRQALAEDPYGTVSRPYELVGFWR